MLHVKDLTVSRARDGYPLISNLNFSLQKGDKLAIIGAEGNGKSALLRVICRPDLAASYLQWSGTVTHQAWRLGYLEQECPQELLEAKVSDYLLPHLSDAELFRQAGLMGLDTDLLYAARPFASLSGGERMKLRLLGLILDRPDIYVLDEPANDLDLEGIAYVESLIREVPEPVLYVSHDETLLDRTATSILHIEQIWRRTEARATYSGLGFREYREQFLYNHEKQNQLAAKAEADYQDRRKRHLEIQDKVHRDQMNISRGDPAGGRLLKKKMHAVKSTGRRMEREYEDRIRRTDREDDVDFFLADMPGLPKDKEVLRLELPELRAGDLLLSENIQLHVGGTERIGITGTNGCGKSTLLAHIYFLLSERKDVTVFYFPQDWRLFTEDQASALEFLDPAGSQKLRQEASNLLGSLNFSREEMLRPPSTLSGGQKVKLAYAKLRLTKPNVLLLDEATRYLSPLSNPAFRRSLADFPGAMISISHDRAFLREICDRVLRLTKKGLIVEDPDLYGG
ncbi:MAG: ATP-binding cassette domain-containing protein [Saccharofermentanales bacterium]